MQKKRNKKIKSYLQTALVTGGAHRVGKEIVKTLHANGYRVCIHYNKSKISALKLAEELNEIRPKTASVVQQNLSVNNAGERLVKKFLSGHQSLDALVNCASVFYKTPIALVDEKAWNNLLDTNLKAIYFSCIYSFQLLKKNKGSIINVSDIHSQNPRSEYSAYCISKAGVETLTQALALDFAPNVRVNCIAPGAIMWAESENDSERKNAMQKIPLKKIGDPRDIAESVLYLVKSNYLTGQVIKVDGGRSLSV